MNNLVLDEKKIDDLVSSYQDTEQLIIDAGSDEHLDLILNIRRSVNKLIDLSTAVNDELERTFNSLTEEKAKDVVLKLSVGLRYAKQIITILRNAHPYIAEGIKSCRKDLYLETKQIDEFVQDLIKYKINNPQELKDLLNSIK